MLNGNNRNGYNGIRGYAINAIQNNPEIRDNPQYQDMIQAIVNNDSKAGIEIANKILQNSGVSRGAGIERAIQMFNLPIGRQR